MQLPKFYRLHLFICTNKVDDQNCCGQRGSEDLFFALRRLVRQAGLAQIAVTRTGCMGRCMSGPALVIYPDNVWYAPHSSADLACIVRDHLEGGKLVTPLLMPALEPPLPGYDFPITKQQ